jgi:zinc protease
MRADRMAGAAGLFLSAALAVATAAQAEPKVTDFRLDNGMKVVVIEDHRAPVATQMVWYRVGAADEPWGHSGIAHFFEHLMFKATDKLADGEFSKIVAENGGQDNAFTSYDYTAFFERIAADRLGLVMGMEADRMRHLVLTKKVVATERDVILEERNSRTDNNPQSLFSEQMMATLYMNHPYGIPVIGWRHEIELLGVADARAFYDRYYAPDNAVLVVAGDVTPDQVKALATKYYGPMKASGRPPGPRPQEPPQRAARRLEMRDARVGQPFVERMYLVPPYDPAKPGEAAALELLSDILGNGITSRLAQSLEIDQGVAIDSGAGYSAMMRGPTGFTVYGVPAKGHDLAAVEAAIDAVIAKIATDGPTEEELARVKRLNRAARIYAEDSQFAQAQLYGSALALGRTVADVQNWPAVLDAVTADDVRRVAAKYLVPEHSVTGWLMGEKETG